MHATSTPYRFHEDDVRRATGTLVRLSVGDDGLPTGATGATLVRAPAEKVWSVVADVSSYSGRIPMIHRMERTGDRVVMKLRFKVALFSFGFEVASDAKSEEGRWLELHYVSGEPRDMRLRLELEPAGDATLVHCDIGFDIESLGWLVKTFLKHHPEIRYGIFPGCAIVLLDSMRRGIEERR